MTPAQLQPNRWSTMLLRVLLGGIFVCAGAIKILDPAVFASDISHYRILPHGAVNLLAIALPWVEVTAGLLLMSGVWTRASALVITMLTIIFLIAVSQAMARGLDIRCGCFGTVGARKAGALTLSMDVGCLAAAFYLFWRTER